MSEVSTYWQRQHNITKRLTVGAASTAAVCWVLSFYASIPASLQTTAHETWFAFTSMVTFGAAVALTIATGVGIAILIGNPPPLPGDNR